MQPDSKSEASMRTALEQQLGELGLDGVSPHLPRVPPPVPDHTLLRRIGQGAYGDVWLARNALGTLRAVKVVYRARFKEDRPYEREFNGILKYEPISRTHESLVQVLHVGRNDEGECFYYVMELADDAEAPSSKLQAPSKLQASSNIELGESPDRLKAGLHTYTPRTLRSELAGRQRLPPTDAAQLALPLAGALAHLHRHGLVHRDIKDRKSTCLNSSH